jgi:hypothetical protein
LKKDEVIGTVSMGGEEKYVFTASEKGHGSARDLRLYFG